MFAVVGAGPAGLSLAWQLRRNGHEVAVVEVADRVGGMSGSRTVSGQRVDLGSHRLHPAMPAEIREAIDELVTVQERRRRGRIRLADAWVPYPLSPLGLARTVPLGVAARAAVDAAAAPFRRDRDDSFTGVVRGRLGDTVLEEFYEPYVRKLWGRGPDELAGELARRRVSASSAGDLIRRVLGGHSTYLYPREGFGTICDAMAKRVPDVRLSTKVTGLVEQPDRVVVGLGDGRIMSVDHVFSTVAAGRTAAWLGLVDPVEVALPTRALVLVYLTVRGRPYTGFDAHYLPDPRVLAARVSEPANYRDTPSDPAEHTVLCAEVPCDVDDPVWAASDAEISTRVVDDLARLELPVPEILAVETIRLPSVYPVMTPAALAALSRAEEALATSSRVTVLGRQGLFTPDNTHHVMQMGFAAAGCVDTSGRFDPDAWADARAHFRDFVVED